MAFTTTQNKSNISTINVLSIGGSFSQDAHRYLHDLARSEHVELETVNLMIGGCPLDRHFRNMKGNRREYSLEVNGHSTGFRTSLEEALSARTWDYVTLQQDSSQSYLKESFHPYINELASYIRSFCPKAKLLIHQTWAYQDHSDKILSRGFHTYDEMFAPIKECYAAVAEEIHADGIIPSGTALQYALRHGIKQVHRDSSHLQLGIGRFILSLVWYQYLTGRDIQHINFHTFDDEITKEEYKIALEAADFAVNNIEKNN